MISFNNWFDSAYIINLAERKDRRDFIEKQLDKLEIDKSLVEWHTSVIHPFNDVLVNEFNAWSQKKHGFFNKPNELGCLYEHYTLVKKSFIEGKKRILIMEDDICFLKDKEQFAQMLDELPKTCDLAQGDCFCANPKIAESLDFSQTWSKHDGVGAWNASFVILNRRGMMFYIDFIDQFFTVADMPYYIAAQQYSNLLDVRLATIPICVQEDKNILKSDIRQSQNETRQENIYMKDVDFKKYFQFQK